MTRKNTEVKKVKHEHLIAEMLIYANINDYAVPIKLEKIHDYVNAMIIQNSLK